MIVSAGAKILYIDDEVNNLVGFKASLRLSYEVFTTSDINEAYAILKKHPDLRIIFCDQRMPGKTGVEFFEEIRSLYPLPVRILLTAYTDVESIIQAINRGHIFRYIKKPWTTGDLLSAIEEGNKFYITNSLLATRNDELKKAYSELDKFANNVSHEIRTPITGMLTGISMAKELDSADELRGFLGMLEQSMQKLNDFIQNMYDYYNQQMGSLLITFIDFDRLIADIENIYAVYAQANHIDFKIEVRQLEPLRSDETALKLIITNLLSNAFKYQRPDHPSKEVRVFAEIRNGFATLVVEDNGIGIPESDMSELFDLFYQSSGRRSGFGLGLYNIKSTLDKLGGTIKVNSTEQQGTAFTVVIPNKF